jgi:hypothetical protein
VRGAARAVVPAVLALSVALSLALAARAQSAAKPAHVMITPAAIKWGPLPDAPPGAMLAVLSGDPGKAGSAYVMRIKTPDGYKIPPHWHPKPERITVIQGVLGLAMGRKYDENALRDFPAGSYAEMPARAPHFGFSRGETVVQVHGVGPFQIVYVNPADKPSNQPRPAAGPSGAAPMAR